MFDRLVLWYLNICSTNGFMAQLHCGLYRWPLRVCLVVALFVLCAIML